MWWFQDATDSEEDDGDYEKDGDSDDAGEYPGGQKEGTGAAERRPVTAEATPSPPPPAAGRKASGGVGAAAGTAALGPRDADAMATVRPRLLVPR